MYIKAFEGEGLMRKKLLGSYLIAVVEPREVNPIIRQIVCRVQS